MSDPTTPNLAVVHLQPHPKQPDIPINAAFDTLDLAQTGLLAKTVTSADVTLTAAEFTNSYYHRITGTLTADHNYIVPASQKPFTVEHSGTVHNLTVKTASGTGIAFAPGTTQRLYCDGVNVVADGPSTTAVGQPYDQSFSVDGLPGDGQLLYVFGPAVRDWRLPSGLVGSDGDIQTAATVGAAVFTLKKGASTIGTISAAVGASVFSVSFVADVDFLAASRHIFRVYAPSPQNATLADFSFVLKGLRI